MKQNLSFNAKGSLIQSDIYSFESKFHYFLLSYDAIKSPEPRL